MFLWFPTIFYLKIWNHPIEATIYKWLALGFQVSCQLHGVIRWYDSHPMGSCRWKALQPLNIDMSFCLWRVFQGGKVEVAFWNWGQETKQLLVYSNCFRNLSSFLDDEPDFIQNKHSPATAMIAVLTSPGWFQGDSGPTHSLVTWTSITRLIWAPQTNKPMEKLSRVCLG